MTKKFPKSDLIAITDEEAPEGYEILEVGDWVHDYKYEVQEIIFSHEGKFYRLKHSRSGSSHTDWYYTCEDWPQEVTLHQVTPVEVTLTRWRNVNRCNTP